MKIEFVFYSEYQYAMGCLYELWAHDMDYPDDGYSYYCRNRVIVGTRYCMLHICRYKGCFRTMDCKVHKCKLQCCSNIKYNEYTNYCVDHICRHKDCYINKYRCKHMCIECRNSERYMFYNKCLDCLEYVDVINTMLSPGFYFGMIPRDITNILLWYL